MELNQCNKHIESRIANVKCDREKIEKCNEWLKRCSIDDDCSSLCSDNTSSDFTESTDNSAMTSGFVFEDSNIEISDIVQQTEDGDKTNINKFKTTPSNFIEKVNIYKSKKVHIGDVIYIEKPIYIKNEPLSNKSPIIPSTETIQSAKGKFSIVKRRNWLAQPPMEERKYLTEPAQYVIICHSATEEGFTYTENTLLVRLIQQFHIESRKWADISYNFIIGSDGTVFEGRGWGVQGAHTLSYNNCSIGICFIGCFINHLPPSIALERAQALIKYGVEIGAIKEDYSLLGHKQCNSFESPGQKLFEEIQNWDHWDSSVKFM